MTNKNKSDLTDQPAVLKKPEPRAGKPAEKPDEYGGPRGKEPTRYGDWEKNGRCIDF
ncbi:MAG: DUF1674 domain-containing protein [Gammaproteobacteria bacterium]